MDQPPPYTVVDNSKQLRELWSLHCSLNQKLAHAQGVKDFFKNWDDTLKNKKESALEQAKQWKTKMTEALERQYVHLVDDINHSTSSDDRKVKEKKEELDSAIEDTGTLAELIKTLIGDRSKDVEYTKAKALLALNKVNSLCTLESWVPAFSDLNLIEVTSPTASWKTDTSDTQSFLSMNSKMQHLALSSPEDMGQFQRLVEEDYIFQYSFKTQTYKDRARCNPKSFLVTDGGDIIVPDDNNHIVKVFSKRGQLKQEIRHKHLKTPRSVACGPQNILAIVDSQDNDVKRFTRDGAYVGATPNLPGPVCVTFDSDGHMVVCDKSYRCVFVLSSDGTDTLLSIQYYKVDSQGASQGSNMYPYFHSPHYVAIGALGEIFVTDRTANSVLTFTETGNYIETCADLKDPYGVTCDLAGRILVAENGANRISSIKGTEAVPVLTKEKHGVELPTYAVMTPDKKIYVSEYLTGLIKVFVPASDAYDGNLEEEPPPAYDEVFNPQGSGYSYSGTAAPSAPAEEYYNEPAPAYSELPPEDFPQPSAPVEEPVFVPKESTI